MPHIHGYSATRYEAHTRRRTGDAKLWPPDLAGKQWYFIAEKLLFYLLFGLF